MREEKADKITLLELLAAVRAGDRKALAQAISVAENQPT